MINIETRDTLNAASMLQPAQKVGELTLRPLSLGSLELLRIIGNPLASGNSAALENIDTSVFAQYIWVHAAPQEKVVDIIFNRIGALAEAVTVFSLAISPADLQLIAQSLQGDLGAIEAASAQPEPTESDNPNAPTPH